MKKLKLPQILYSLLGVAFIIGLWLLLYLVVQNSYIIPAPFVVIKNGIMLLFSGEFYLLLLSTLLRVLCGVIISLTLAGVLATICVYHKTFNAFIAPIMATLRSLPTLAVLLIILVFIDRNFAPVVVCMLSLIPLAFSEIYDWLKKSYNTSNEMLTLYNVSKKTQVKVYLVGILPTLVKEFFTLFSFGLKLVVSGEILANVYKSIGGTIHQASTYSNTIYLMALTLVVCVIGIVLEVVGKIISSKMEGKYL